MFIKSKFWPWALGLLILSLLSCYIRLYPLRAHIWDDAHEQATLLALFNIKQTFLKGILIENPSIPPSLANHMAEEKMNETLHKDNRKVMQYIDQLTEKLANQPNPDGSLKLAKRPKIYLLESDPYDFYNLTENIIAKGRIADTIKASKYFNPLMCAPFGMWQPFTLHPYWGFIIYKIAQIFDPSIPLMSAAAYTPLVTYLLILAAFLWVCRSLN
ncbi:MAG: hypothetical protein HQL13_08355, partial [Candidatus Omnitrophica bacterium]|nr:hypothetical protein [Candidatus Omnitrophota bacterium]